MFSHEDISQIETTGNAQTHGCYHCPENHEWGLKIWVLIVNLSFKFDEIQNDYSIQTLIFLAGVELKKKDCLRRLN